jgi:hypothetical protein
MKILFRQKILKDLETEEEFLQFLSETDYMPSLPKEFKDFFQNNINETFNKSDLEPKKLRSKFYGKVLCSTKPYFYLIRGYTQEQAEDKVKELILKQSNANKEKVKQMSSDERKSFILNKTKGFKNTKTYWINQGLTEKEAKEKVKLEQSKTSKEAWNSGKMDNRLIPSNPEYWTEQGLNEKEAKEKVKEFQSKFSYDKLLLKYSADEADKIFNNRQIKWQKSYKSTMIEKYNVKSFVETKDFQKLIVPNKPEAEIIEFIKSIYDGEIIHNDREVLNGKELDIFIPKFNFAIEYNGILWHSDGLGFPKTSNTKNSLIEKTNQCEDKNIHLFHILDTEWDVIKKQIWFSKIAIKLGKVKRRIFARKCIIKQVDTEQEKEFLFKNHLQSYTPSSKAVGLFLEDELVCLSTFGQSRFKKGETELIRFASLKNCIVVGGFSKLTKDETFISYGNRRWTYKENVYNKTLRLEHISPPNFFYYKNKLFSRMTFQKHKLSEKLDNFDKNLTAKENMLLNGFRIFYDSGNYKYSKEL